MSRLAISTSRADGDERGLALIAVLLWISLTAALGSVLILVVSVETVISARHRDGMETLYAADAAIEIAARELAGTSTWNAVLNGTATSTFADGAPVGIRRMPDGTILNLTSATNDLRCGNEARCTDADLTAVTAERPWGVSNPRWQLYAYGPLRRAAGAASTARCYVLVWIADDPWDNDGDPLRDGDAADNAGRGRILAIAQAYGTGGTRRTIQVTLARAGSSIRMVSWREIR